LRPNAAGALLLFGVRRFIAAFDATFPGSQWSSVVESGDCIAALLNGWHTAQGKTKIR